VKIIDTHADTTQEQCLQTLSNSVAKTTTQEIFTNTFKLPNHSSLLELPLKNVLQILSTPKPQ